MCLEPPGGVIRYWLFVIRTQSQVCAKPIFNFQFSIFNFQLAEGFSSSSITRFGLEEKIVARGCYLPYKRDNRLYPAGPPQ